MSWFLYSLIVLFIFTFWNLWIKILAVESKDQRAFSFVYNLWGALFAIALYALTTKSAFSLPRIAPIGVALILTASLFYGGFERLQFYARKAIDASTITILLRLAPVVTFVASIVFLRESITLSKSIGIITIVCATLIITYKNIKLSINKNLILALVCAILLGLGWTIDKKATLYIPNALYTLVIWILPLMVIYFPHIPSSSIVNEFRIGSWKTAFLAFLNVLGYYLQLKALSLADASKVIPIIHTSSVFVVIGGIYILKEKEHIGKKIVAAILATIGVFFLR